MKRFIFLILFLIFAQTSVLAKSLEFAIVSDPHLVSSGHPTLFNNSEKNVIFTVESINKNKNIKFVVFLGDCIDKSNMKNLEAFMNIVQNLNKPYYMVLGDFDAYSAGGISKEDFTAFIHEYNSRQPKKDTSFQFKANEDSFGLIADGSSYVVPSKHGRYLPELLKNSEKLFKYKKNDMIFIFQHFPLIQPNDNDSLATFDTERYLEIISKYKNVVLVASGHFHHKKLTIDDNGIYHISAPALGSSNGLAGSGCYEIIRIDYDKKLFSKPHNIKVNIKDIKI